MQLVTHLRGCILTWISFAISLANMVLVLSSNPVARTLLTGVQPQQRIGSIEHDNR